MTIQQTPLQVFCSYAHEDKELFHQLYTALAVLRRQEKITVWHDGELTPGIVWEEEIERQLHTADIILLLISPSFIASDFCWSKEMHWAITRHTTGESCIIPILLRPTPSWETTSLGILQALPDGAKPISYWNNYEEALANVVNGLQKTIDSLQQEERYSAKEYRITSRIQSFDPQDSPDMTKIQEVMDRAEQWVRAVSQKWELQQITEDPFKKEWLLTEHKKTCHIMLRWYEDGPSQVPRFLSSPSISLLLTSTHLALLDQLLEMQPIPYHMLEWTLPDISGMNLQIIEEAAVDYREVYQISVPYNNENSLKYIEFEIPGSHGAKAYIIPDQPSSPAKMLLGYGRDGYGLDEAECFYQAHRLFSIQKMSLIFKGLLSPKQTRKLIRQACLPYKLDNTDL